MADTEPFTQVGSPVVALVDILLSMNIQRVCGLKGPQRILVFAVNVFNEVMGVSNLADGCR